MTLANWESDLDRRAEEWAARTTVEQREARKRVFFGVVAIWVVVALLILGYCA